MLQPQDVAEQMHLEKPEQERGQLIYFILQRLLAIRRGVSS
jgi:hypothetical protein